MSLSPAPTLLDLHTPSTASAAGPAAAAAAEDPRVLAAIEAIFDLGGNAVDAAIAGVAMQGVCRPMSGGLGGGGFGMIRLPTGRVVVLEHRDAANGSFGPASLTWPDGTELPDDHRRVHGNAVGVPGAARAWHEALTLYGTLTFAQVLAPAIELAEAGFAVDETLRGEIAARAEDFRLFPASRELYLTDSGDVLPIGTVIRNPDLAATYRRLAEHGVEDFYTGEVAAAIVDAVRHPVTDSTDIRVRPGDLTAEDLAGYTVRHCDPIRYRYRGFDMAGPPLPSSGAITIAEILGLLERWDGQAPPRDLTDRFHRFLLACEAAYADRDAFLGDDALIDVPGVALRSDAYLQQRFADLADPSTRRAAGDLATAGMPYVGASPDSPSTIHLSVDDGRGTAVAWTTTIVSMGGCGMVVPGTGFLLNDALAGLGAGQATFLGSARPLGSSRSSPGMRPLSSMAPTMVFREGQQVLNVGSPGGTTIITTVAQILYLALGADLPLDQAVAHPRVTQRGLLGGTAQAEPAFLALPLAQELADRGHRFATWTARDGIGAATAIGHRNIPGDISTVTAVAEPVRRGRGYAATWSV